MSEHETETPTTAEIEIYIVVDEEGSFEVSDEADDASERYVENYGMAVRQLTKLVLTVPLPKERVATGTLPEGDDVKLTLTET